MSPFGINGQGWEKGSVTRFQGADVKRSDRAGLKPGLSDNFVKSKQRTKAGSCLIVFAIDPQYWIFRCKIEHSAI